MEAIQILMTFSDGENYRTLVKSESWKAPEISKVGDSYKISVPGAEIIFPEGMMKELVEKFIRQLPDGEFEDLNLNFNQ